MVGEPGPGVLQDDLGVGAGLLEDDGLGDGLAVLVGGVLAGDGRLERHDGAGDRHEADEHGDDELEVDARAGTGRRRPSHDGRAAGRRRRRGGRRRRAAAAVPGAGAGWAPGHAGRALVAQPIVDRLEDLLDGRLVLVVDQVGLDHEGSPPSTPANTTMLVPSQSLEPLRAAR